MTTLTCPYPENINPLLSNGFMFSISKLPELTYFCQTGTIPAIVLPTVNQPTPFSDSKISGDKIEFENLTINFMVDENMKNFIAIQSWMRGLGFPTSNQEYIDFLSNSNVNLSESSKQYSDGTLSILNSSYNPIRSLKFVDLIPIQLGSLEFSSTNTDSAAIIATATFAYSYYTI